MKKERILVIFFVFSLLFFLSFPASASSNNKKIFNKGLITEVNGYSVIAVKNGRTFTIDAQSALLTNSLNRQVAISQFYVGDQIDVRGRIVSEASIAAKTIKNRSIRGAELNIRGLGHEAIQDGAVRNASIAENANISSSKIDLSNLNFGTTTLRNGNFTGNWNFNSGNLSSIGNLQCENLSMSGEINLAKNSSQPFTCDSAHDGDVALTDFYVTCVCKNGTGWVLTADGTTACAWQSPGPRDLDPVLSGREMSFPVAANTAIPQNTLVRASTTGWALPCADTAGMKFVGVSKEAADNTGGANGDIWVTAYQQGNFEFAAQSLTQAMVGSSMYVINGSTMDDATGPTNDVRLGILSRYVSATEGWVKIN
jgi:hypothetical protein